MAGIIVLGAADGGANKKLEEQIAIQGANTLSVRRAPAANAGQRGPGRQEASYAEVYDVKMADGRFFKDAGQRAGAKAGVLCAMVAAKLFGEAAVLCASK